MKRVDPVKGGFFLMAGDPQVTDKHELGGTVSVDGEPMAEQMVTVLDRRTMIAVGATGSLPDGSWHVSGIPYADPRSLVVVACSSLGTFNAEVADLVTPVRLIV